jgi:hypothetical protein
MTIPRPNAVPRVPTLPRGEEVAAYDTYLEAQRAVDYLSDHKFTVELVTIVGTDLRMVERVTGRLTYGRVAVAGMASGAWFGLFVGLLLFMFSGQGAALAIGVGLGAGFGLLFSVLSYMLTGRGRRDFTSSSQIVASSYAILCAHEAAGEARRMLSEMPGGAGGIIAAGAPPTWTHPAPTTVARPVEVPDVSRPTPDPRWTTPSGEPRYGAMRPTPGQDDQASPAPEENESR